MYWIISDVAIQAAKALFTKLDGAELILFNSYISLLIISSVHSISTENAL